MMAQDQEKRKVAEFERQQASAKKATDLANSLKRIPKPVPKKTDEEDVLDLVQKLDHEDNEDNEKAAGEQQDFDGPVK